MITKYFGRVVSSQRGEKFNPLIWPFLIGLLAYGVGFSLFSFTEGVGKSSLYIAMLKINSEAPHIWGGIAVGTIIVGLTFLLFNIPPAGRVSGLVGFMLWVFAGFCWAFGGAWLPVLSIAIPNLWFWFWQYLSLSAFRKQDAQDIATMEDYNEGKYDDELNPKDSKITRDQNRGVDLQ